MPARADDADDDADDVVPFREAVRVWAAVSLQTFGGPAGQIAVMHREIVERRRWVGERRFLHALSFCTLLPGPEAQQLATYLGWLLNGVRGGLLAGGLFVLPGFVALLALSALYVTAGGSDVVEALFTGLAAAVLAIVGQAVLKLASRTLLDPALVVVAVAAFAALALFAVPFPLVVAAAAVAGWVLGRLRPAAVRPAARTAAGRAPGSPGAAAEADGGPAPLVADDDVDTRRPSRSGTAGVLAVGVLAWGVPLALVALLAGGIYADLGLFFSGAAVVTFGGAYAVLAYVAQHAVTVGWLAPGEMVRGLALAETTPGPLIMVVQFVAFVAAFRDAAPLSPWPGAVLACVLVVWVTFVPSVVLVLAGAPYVETLRGHAGLTAALTGIMAAVVGVIANLGLFFAVNTLFAATRVLSAGPLRLEVPDLATFRPVPAAIAAVAAVLLLRQGWSVLRVLGLCALAGVASWLAIAAWGS